MIVTLFVLIHNKSTNGVILLDLTCSVQHLESARDKKQTKEDYLYIFYLSWISCYYFSVEVFLHDHYLESSLSPLLVSQSQGRMLLIKPLDYVHVLNACKHPYDLISWVSLLKHNKQWLYIVFVLLIVEYHEIPHQ